jgi:hypothetical protein
MPALPPPIAYEYDPEAQLLCTTVRCTAPKPMKRAQPAKIAKANAQMLQKKGSVRKRKP